MNRLTELDEYGNADIIGVDSEDLQLNLDFEGFNRVTEALNRLARYEDSGLEPEEIKRSDALLRGFIDLSRRHARTLSWMENVMMADREGRLVVLPARWGTNYGLRKTGKFNAKPFIEYLSMTGAPDTRGRGEGAGGDEQ